MFKKKEKKGITDYSKVSSCLGMLQGRNGHDGKSAVGPYKQLRQKNSKYEEPLVCLKLEG